MMHKLKLTRLFLLIIISLQCQNNLRKCLVGANSSSDEASSIKINILKNEELLWKYEKHNAYDIKFYQFENNKGFNKNYAKSFIEDLTQYHGETLKNYSIEIVLRLGFENIVHPVMGNVILFKIQSMNEKIIENNHLCFNLRILSKTNSMKQYLSRIQQIENCANIPIHKHLITDGRWHIFVAKISRRHVKISLDCRIVFNEIIKDENFGNWELIQSAKALNVIIAKTNLTDYSQIDIKHITISSDLKENNLKCNATTGFNYYIPSHKIELTRKFYLDFEHRDWDSSKFYHFNKSFYTNIVLPQTLMMPLILKNFTFECIFRCYKQIHGQIALLSMFDSISGYNMNFGINSGSGQYLAWNNILRTQSKFQYSRGVLSNNILNGEWNHILIKINSDASTKILKFYLNCELLSEETLDGALYFLSSLQQIILFKNISATTFENFDIKKMNLYTNLETDECNFEPL